MRQQERPESLSLTTVFTADQDNVATAADSSRPFNTSLRSLRTANTDSRTLYLGIFHIFVAVVWKRVYSECPRVISYLPALTM